MRDLSTGDVIAIAAVVALIAGSVPAGRWACRAARREESQKDRFIRECTPGLEVWDDRLNRWITLPPGVRPGPGQHTDREVASLDELTLAWDADPFDPAADPQWAAGRERLFDAIRDHRANTPEGEA